MRGSKRIFVAAWEYPPALSGESVVCRRMLENSVFDYDICCGPDAGNGDSHVRCFPVRGHKYLAWPFATVRQFRELDRTEHYRIMMSRVMPPNGHLAGWLIKKIKPEIKWIAYFSDPVWNSPFLRFSIRKNRDCRPNWFLMKAFGFPAKWALENADLLIFNNRRLARYVLGKRYERLLHRTVFVPYGHDGVKPRPLPARADGKFRLTHVGQIYGDRTLRSLVEGAELLRREEPELFQRLELRQVGFVCEAEQQRVLSSPAAGAFRLVGQVSYPESMEEMYAADCLLVIDPEFDDRGKNIYIPGKVYDYMSTGRPIVCIAHKDSATGDLAAAAGLPRVAQEGRAVCEYLRKLISSGIEISVDHYADFTVGSGVRLMDQEIARLDCGPVKKA